ncbi:MAG: hypothetical protein M3393_07145 [Actinomycetota bacterium]|nr:hypothetical protein [Actinomycetota bacterium]
MLALLESERARAQEALDRGPRLIFATWGIAWLLGFSVFWSATDAASPVDLSMPIASVFFAVCTFSAVVVTMTHVARRVPGVLGVSSTVGAMYGWSWFLAFVTLTSIMLGAVRSVLPDETAGLFWSVLLGLWWVSSTWRAAPCGRTSSSSAWVPGSWCPARSECLPAIPRCTS